MNAEPASLRAFFGFLTLACVSLAAFSSARSFRAPAIVAVALVKVSCAAIGAALGSLFGRPKVGALCAFIAMEATALGNVTLFRMH